MYSIRHVLGLILVCSLTHALNAQSQKPENLDEKFYSVLHGYDSDFETGSQKWQAKLISIVNESSSQNHAGAQQQNQIELAMQKYPAPQDTSQEFTLRYSEISRAYNKIRLESPDSTWFKETRFPQLLQSLMNKLSAPEAAQPKKQDPAFCPPESGAASQLSDATSILSQVPQAATAKTPAAEDKQASLPPKTTLQNRAEAVKFVESLDLTQLPSNPDVISRTAAMEEALKASLKRGRSINQWPTDAKATRIIFHHTATGTNLDASDVQRMHLGRGWADVGYHFLIDSNGVIHEGRDLAYQGANAKGNNTDSIGVGFIGNFHPYDAKENPSGYTSAESEAPSEAQIQAAVALAQALRDSESTIYKYAASKGLTLEITDIMGHTDCVATACPGEAGLPIVRAIKEKLLVPKADPKTELKAEGSKP